jgi:hypothetical protein
MSFGTLSYKDTELPTVKLQIVYDAFDYDYVDQRASQGSLEEQLEERKKKASDETDLPGESAEQRRARLIRQAAARMTPDQRAEFLTQQALNLPGDAEAQALYRDEVLYEQHKSGFSNISQEDLAGQARDDASARADEELAAGAAERRAAARHRAYCERKASKVPPEHGGGCPPLRPK